MSPSVPNLREQNRQRTGAVIHKTTYTLVCSQGIAATSIDDIAEAAGVSRRTFFNYYASKENALYGLMHPLLTDTARTAFLESEEPTLLRCALLVLSIYRTSIAEGSTSKRRRELHQRYPETRAKIDIHMTELEKLVEPLVSQLHTDDTTSIALILYASGAVLKYCHTIDPSMSEATFREAINTLHTITKEK